MQPQITELSDGTLFIETGEFDPTTGRERVRWELPNGTVGYGYAGRPGKGYTVVNPNPVRTGETYSTCAHVRLPDDGAARLSEWATSKA